MPKDFVFTEEWKEYVNSKIFEGLWDLYDAIAREVNAHILDKEYSELIKARDYIRNEIRIRP